MYAIVYSDIEEAAKRLQGAAHRTPLLRSRQLDERTGAEVLLKAECFQRAGAFKFRGAYNAMSLLDAEARRRGVLTWSSGNHAQAVALAGRILGIPRTIVMPTDAPEVKRRATEGYGAEVVLYDRAETTREELGTRIASERGLAIVPPYDHPHVIAGQGTSAKELFEDAGGRVDALFVPVGGGGLISGCAIAAEALAPDCAVIGVEPAAADDAARSFRTGELHTVRDPETIADGARTPSLGEWTFPVVRRLVRDIVTVDDAAIARGAVFLWERMKVLAEPTGALALAGLIENREAFAGKRVGVIVSGGNMDLAKMGRILELAG